jgi:hypothetical protein
MDKTKTEAPQRPAFELWPWLGVLVVLLLAGFVRYRLLDMPLERDEGEYAYAGQLLLQGIPPYQLAWNMKLPGTYFMYALGMAVFGQTAAGVHATLMVVNSLTIIFIFVLGRRLFGPLAGVAACATFGILSVSPAVLGMAAHANHFVILFAVWGTLLLWRGEEFYRWNIFFLSGVLFGLAFLMKQQGICFCLFAVTMVIWNGVRNKAILSTVFFRKILFLGIGMILPLALTYKALELLGVLPKFWFWTYTYAVSYAMELTPREGISRFSDYAEKKWLIYFAFLGFILVSLPFVMRDRAYRNQILFATAFMFFSIIGVAIDFNFREHYFILLLPALGLFVGLAIIALQYATEHRFFKIIPPLVCLGILGWTVYEQREFFFKLPANAVSRIVYTGDTPFVDMPAVGDYIRTNSATDATVAVIGSEPEIYFYAHRHSATGYLYMYALMEPQPFASQMQYEMMNEIQTNKPEFLVYINDRDSWNVRPASDPSIFKWFSNYTTNYDKVLAMDPVTTVPGKAGKNVTTTHIDAIIYRRK